MTANKQTYIHTKNCFSRDWLDFVIEGCVLTKSLSFNCRCAQEYSNLLKSNELVKMVKTVGVVVQKVWLNFVTVSVT